MKDRLRFLMNRIGERLWVKPLIMCILSIAGAFVAKGADYTQLGQYVPSVTEESVGTLLGIISSSMLVIATFAVASMVSAYASASSTATPRTFSLVIADDVSQNALSAFIGAFIFSIVSLIAMQNSFYDKAGRFTLFVLTLVVFAIVIVTFVRWVDRVARLGRLGTTVDKVEKATSSSLTQRRTSPRLGGTSVAERPNDALPVYAQRIGYVQRVNIPALQSIAEAAELRIEVASLPGSFSSPGNALAYVIHDSGATPETDVQKIESAFLIGDDRTFDEDPRFGLIVMSEIASRALSPGINDPGTAIDVIGTLVRLFALWGQSEDEQTQQAIKYDRVAVPEIALADMFEDAFSAIARDGSGTIEVLVRLQKAFKSLACVGHPEMHELAILHARRTLQRAEQNLGFAHDLDTARQAAEFAKPE